MKFHFRKTWRPGPFRITLTEKLRPTWGVRIGRYGYDPKTGKHSLDTPGLGYVRSSGRSRRREDGSGSSLGSIIRGLFLLVTLGALGYVVLVGWPL